MVHDICYMLYLSNVLVLVRVLRKIRVVLGQRSIAYTVLYICQHDMAVLNSRGRMNLATFCGMAPCASTHLKHIP